MECFKIEWKGLFSLEEVLGKQEAKQPGIYTVYQTEGKNPKKIWYIGKSQEIGKRLSSHIQNWSHILPQKSFNKLQVCIGIIYSIEGGITSPHISDTQLRDIESYLITYFRPEGNGESTKKKYSGSSVLLINLGKIGLFNKVMCHDTELLTLLKQSLVVKKARTKSSSW